MRARILATLTLLGLVTVAYGAYIPVKAAVAQRLLQRAWAQTLADGGAHKPWPWADTHPVARLRLPAHDVDLIALAGATGSSLAFGPGHVSHSGAPGSRDTVVFGGHRDTHFRFLRKVATGDLIELHLRDGDVAYYRIEHTQIADIGTTELHLAPDSDTLALVTCYPFDAPRAGSNERYVVSARGVSL